MIDLFVVVSFGGFVRWSFVSHKFDHLQLVNAVLNHLSASLSGRVSESELAVRNNLLKWFINEELGLVYILAHPKMFPIDWSAALFKKIDLFIASNFAERLESDQFLEFENSVVLDKFKEITRKEEMKAKEAKNLQGKAKGTSVNSPKIVVETVEANRRSWSDKASKNDLKALDFSEATISNRESETAHMVASADAKSKLDDPSDSESNSSTLSDSELSGDDTESRKRNKSTWWNSLKSITGNNPLTLEDLNTALQAMKMHLISKNVASDSADFVVNSVGKCLVGRIPGTFSSVSRMVRDATRETVQKILTPTKPNDLLNEISIHKRSGEKRPFVMAFIGVNGVGKSTNLSKVAFWLLQHQFKVLLVAGDTFRAGAVEQLKQHCRNLSSVAPGRIEIYERGYGKDAALVAQDAIKYAQTKGFDLVLIDTAGRMQDNGPLMIALAKLVNMNRPDRVIFVGEALVGHNALCQLEKFNAALLDHSAKPIDGILLTKVDTIDDKIGAALSMTLTAKAPILFMGVGQTYTDLKRINIKQVVDLLLK